MEVHVQEAIAHPMRVNVCLDILEYIVKHVYYFNSIAYYN